MTFGDFAASDLLNPHIRRQIRILRKNKVQNSAEHTARELRGPMLRPLGLRSSSFERVRRCCILRKADCGLRRIAALTGLRRIADGKLGTLQSKDASQSPRCDSATRRLPSASAAATRAAKETPA
eukprot:5522621-Alexandrium_andersonii.AAC.1